SRSGPACRPDAARNRAGPCSFSRGRGRLGTFEPRKCNSGASSVGATLRGRISRPPYRMRAVFSAGEVHHAIDAGKGSTATAVSMRVKLLLGQDVAARLREVQRHESDDAARSVTQLVLAM